MQCKVNKNKNQCYDFVNGKKFKTNLENVKHIENIKRVWIYSNIARKNFF